jgi:hypothetical protein
MTKKYTAQELVDQWDTDNDWLTRRLIGGSPQLTLVTRLRETLVRLEAAEAVCEITTNPLYSTDDHQDYKRMREAKEKWRRAALEAES